MIFTCPEYILNINLNQINNKVKLSNKKNIYYAAEQLIYFFTNFRSINLKNFNKIIFEFDLQFKNFLQMDKIEKVYTYCNDWMETEETIESIKISKKYQQEEKDSIINNLIKTQEQLKSILRYLIYKLIMMN